MLNYHSSPGIKILSIGSSDVVIGVQWYLCKLFKNVQSFKKLVFYTANGIWFCVASPRFAGMGNLLKVLTREIENYPHFFLDFESKFQKLKDYDENFSLSL